MSEASKEKIILTDIPEQELVTEVWFKNLGRFNKEDEGIPIIINDHPVGAITKVGDALVEGFIINRYIGLEVGELIGKKYLSGICLGRGEIYAIPKE